MIRVVHPRSGSWFFPYLGSGSRGSKRHRIPDPYLQHRNLSFLWPIFRGRVLRWRRGCGRPPPGPLWSAPRPLYLLRPPQRPGTVHNHTETQPPVIGMVCRIRKFTSFCLVLYWDWAAWIFVWKKVGNFWRFLQKEVAEQCCGKGVI